MSQLLIKQRVFSWSDTYDVYDEKMQAKYYVKADLFSLGKSIHIYDKATNEEVGYIKQKVLVLLQEYEIFIHGQSVGRIKRLFSFLKPKFEVDYGGWQVEGDLFGWSYRCEANGQTVFYVQKKLLSWGDTYILDIVDETEELPALLVNIAIDAACHDGSSGSHSD